MKTYSNYENAVRLAPCTYGVSRLAFRGPRRSTDGRFVAFLGGSDTFARYVPEPFCELVEAETGEVCVNLGCQASGPDVYLKDTAIHSMCHDASAVVIQIIGAANLSNAYYKVHPRRNDRFIAPTERLVALYPEVDFSEISFTGHLISRLQDVDEARFALVRTCLQATWEVRMRALIKSASANVFLLWFASRGPEAHSEGMLPSHEPMFITAEMLERLRADVEDIVVVVSPRGETKGMAFPALDSLAAHDSLGVVAHQAAAKALHDPLMRCLA